MSESPASATHMDPVDTELQADVCVIGAGIIGLHNALQYAKRGFTVAVVDELTERSKSAYKVGESLLGFSNAFLRSIGDLDKEIGESFEKKGVWFAYGMEGKEEFNDDVSEWGFQSSLPTHWRERIDDPKFARTMFDDRQIVRPEIEAVMRARIKDHPEITLVDRGLVKDVQLGEGDAGDHEITWRSRDGKASGTVRSRWVIDCSGRARLLVKKFGHDVPLDDGFSTSAVWGQFSGCTDDIFDERWNYTFPDGEVTRRDLDTIHLWGDGYWIWLIRLTDQRISVGVSFNRNRPPSEGNLRQVFWDVIRRYPLLNFLTEENQLDFAAYRNVQHISDTYVSARRYAIAGDAASIIDAYYSQGISLALVTSWHAANIVERDLRDDVLDTDYIDHVNRATLADWQIMRTMVKNKYSPAIADSRFFILDHLLDYLVFSAALPGRYQVTRWLTETGGYTRSETPEQKDLRSSLTRRLFLSQSAPWHRFDPAMVVKAFEGHRDGLESRALWRMSKGISLRPTQGVLRPNSPLPAMWRLPYLRLKRRADLTPRAIKEPAFLRPKLTKKLPAPLATFGPIVAPFVASSVIFDLADTALRRIGHLAGGGKRRAPSPAKPAVRKP